MISQLMHQRALALLATTLFSLPIALAANSTTLVGKLPGDVAVNNTGQASYTIPLELPAGIAGLKPELSIEYSSQGGYGPLGVGWSLSGLSSVTRTGSVYAIDVDPTDPMDPGLQGVQYDNTVDKFAIDGQRLMHVGGSAYGLDGALYRTRIDDFTRVTLQGTGHQIHFKAETKSGLTKYYGHDPDTLFNDQSSLVLNGNSEQDAVTAWALDKIVDTNGNAIDYVYGFDAATNEQYLDRITYANSLVEIELIYDTDPRVLTSYHNGAKIQRSKRLTDIVAKVSAQEQWRYTIAYEMSTDTNRSRLKSVTKTYQTESGAMSLPATTVNYRASRTEADVWADAGPDYLLNVETTSNAADKNGIRFVDLNADGRTDYLYRSNLNNRQGAFLNTPSGFVAAPEFIPPSTITWDSKDEGVALVDLNGDGYPDFIRSYWDRDHGGYWASRIVRLNNKGEGWESENATDYFLPYPLATDEERRSPIRFVDLNGDGLVDILWHRWISSSSQEVGACLNTGSGWMDAPDYYPPYHITDKDYTDLGVQFVDLNGDGLVDMAWNRSLDSDSQVGVRLNTGSGWSTTDTVAYHPPKTFIHKRTPRGARFMDINGDGLVDFLKARQGESSYYAYLNTGNGWEESANYKPPTKFIDSDGAGVGIDFFDVNADGLVDILRHEDDDSSGNRFNGAWLNTGSGWLRDDRYKTKQPVDYDELSTGRENVDLDGDGILDQVVFQAGIFYPEYKGSYFNNHSVPDLLESVVDGFQVETKLAYKPITDADVYSRESDEAEDLVSTFPIVEFQAPMWVVESVTKDSGLGTDYTTSYRYSGARMHLQGFGFLGFRVFTSHDEQTGLTKAEILRQDDPFTGMKEAAYTLSPEQFTSGVAPVSLGRQILSISENHFPLVDPLDPINGYNEIVTPVAGITMFPTYKGSEEWKTEFDSDLDTSALSFSGLIDHAKQYAYGNTFTANGTHSELTAGSTHPVTQEVLTEDIRYVASDGFDEFGNILKIFIDYGDGYSQETINTYDVTATTINNWHLGRLLRAEVTSTAPDTTGQVETVTRESQFGYGPNGLLQYEWIVTASAALDTVSFYNRDAQGRITASTLYYQDATGAWQNHIPENHANLDSTERFYTKTTNALNHSETRAYDPFRGWVDSQTGPNGRTTYFQYDALGRAIREDRPDGTWSATTHEYDDSLSLDYADGTVTSVYKVTTTATLAPTTITWYDKLGRALRTATEAHQEDGDYTSAKWVYQDTGYNALGQVDCVSENYFASDGGPSYWTKTTFDALGRPDVVTAPDGTKLKTIYNERETTTIRNFVDFNTDPLLAAEPSTYGALVPWSSYEENQTTVTRLNAKGDTETVYSYNDDGDALTLDYHYDGVGNLLETVKSSPNDGTVKVSMTYDIRGNKTSLVDPDMGTWEYTYNALGQLIEQTDAKQQVTRKEYDQLGRVTIAYYGYVSATDFQTKHNFYYDGDTDGDGSSDHQHHQIGKLHLERATIKRGGRRRKLPSRSLLRLLRP